MYLSHNSKAYFFLPLLYFLYWIFLILDIIMFIPDNFNKKKKIMQNPNSIQDGPCMTWCITFQVYPPESKFTVLQSYV